MVLYLFSNIFLHNVLISTSAMTQSLRKAACRTYALQALNWLLRSVSQPACLHDLLWCFVAALEANSTTASNGSNMNDDKAGSSGKDKKNKKIEAAMQQQKAVRRWFGLFRRLI